MEFADLIKISRLDNVRLRKAGEVASQGCDATVVVTGHHLILSLEESVGNLPPDLYLAHDSSWESVMDAGTQDC